MAEKRIQTDRILNFASKSHTSTSSGICSTKGPQPGTFLTKDVVKIKEITQKLLILLNVCREI